MHKLSARYGVSLYDPEALWLQMNGTEEELESFKKRRHDEFSERVGAEVERRLLKFFNINEYSGIKFMGWKMTLSDPEALVTIVNRESNGN